CSLLSSVLLASSAFLSIATALTASYTLSLHDALPIFGTSVKSAQLAGELGMNYCFGYFMSNAGDMKAVIDTYRENFKPAVDMKRSEEHTSELQSRFDLVCRLLLEKKKTYIHAAQK